MKRLLALILAAILLAVSLAGCASSSQKSAAISAKIRLTSSDAADAAAWLTARLGERLSDSVVLGTDAVGYGVDLDALENDGFFIRSFGREDVLFAKTAEGLDRAVRRYAKTVEAGEPISDVTYHEGAFVGRLTIAGADISTFGVRVEETAAGNNDDEPGGDWGEWIPMGKGETAQSGDVTRLKDRVARRRGEREAPYRLPSDGRKELHRGRLSVRGRGRRSHLRVRRASRREARGLRVL